MPSQNLEYLSLSDFSAGISGNPLPGQFSEMAGTQPSAQVTNTYRCLPLPSGGIGPMPKRSLNRSYSPNVTEVLGNKFHLLDFMVYGPTGSTESTADPFQTQYQAEGVPDHFDPTSSSRHDLDFYLLLAYQQDTGAGNYVRKLRWVAQLNGSVATTQLGVRTGAAVNPTEYYLPGYMVLTRSIGDKNPDPIEFTQGRAQTDPGTPVVVVSATLPQPDYTAGVMNLMYPDPTDFETFATTAQPLYTTTPLNMKSMSGSFDVGDHGIPIAHQGRIVFVSRFYWIRGGARQGVWIADDFVYTQVNYANLDNVSGTISRLSAAPEAPFGVGAWGSQSASDLFLVRHRDGGVLLQGDLNSPIVRFLPGVHPTYGMESVGANSPLGFVYGSNHAGVHIWQGGTETVHISPNLPGDFWQFPTNVIGLGGRFAYWRDFVMVPNNWVYHIPSESWWRIENPDDLVISHWQPSPYGTFCYGTSPSHTYGGGYTDSTDVIYGWDAQSAANSYSWQSHPILATNNRRLSFREAVILMQGAGTVTVTLTGQDGTTTTFSFTTTNNQPSLQRANIAMSAETFTIRIVATGASGGAAPNVYKLDLGHEMRNKIAGA